MLHTLALGGGGRGLRVGGGGLRGSGPESWGSVNGGRGAGLDAVRAKTSEEGVCVAGVGYGEGAELAVVLEGEA